MKRIPKAKKIKDMKKLIVLLVAVVLGLLGYELFPIEQKSLTGMEVTYLDVGNADCAILRMEDGTNLVIDAATEGQEEKILAKLQQKGIEKIDFLIATHPHSDHIGSMEAIMDAVQVDNIVLPSAVHTSNLYEDLLKAIKAHGISATRAEAGVMLKETETYQLQLVAPQKGQDYESLNDYSAVLHVTYGETRFLFTGDAEELSEQEMLAYDIRADVLKVGHHGSRTSSSKTFIGKVNPRIAIISCDEKNSYGHPHAETLRVLQDARIYRTDEDGDITVHTNGTQITVETQK